MTKPWRDLNYFQRIEVLKELSINNNQKQTARILECSVSVIQSFCRKYKIKLWYQGAQLGNKNAEIDGFGRNTIMRSNKRKLTEIGRNIYICERCNRKNPFGLAHPIHHTDRNRINNDPSNLEILCQTCHTKEHLQDRTRGEDGRYVS